MSPEPAPANPRNDADGGAWTMQTKGAKAIPIHDMQSLTSDEKDALQEALERQNFAVYQCPEHQVEQINCLRALCEQVGLLTPLDNPAADKNRVTEICAVSEQRTKSQTTDVRPRYIPFSNKALGWHTDGYYHADENKVRAFVLHCVRPAAVGGENTLLDHRQLWQWLHDQNPLWIQALSHPHTLTIPANQDQGKTLRAAFSGPVFSEDEETGELYMRYTERSRHINWRQDSDTADALEALKFRLHQQSSRHTRITLQRGQGLLCNNVLHMRTAFEDSANEHQSRLLYRIRFNERAQFQ